MWSSFCSNKDFSDYLLIASLPEKYFVIVAQCGGVNDISSREWRHFCICDNIFAMTFVMFFSRIICVDSSNSGAFRCNLRFKSKKCLATDA